MKCEREQQVIDATRNGSWSSSLRAHLRDCALCAQTERIATSLQETAANRESAVRSSAGWPDLAPRPDHAA